MAAQERDAKRGGNKLLDGFKDAADEFGDGLKNAGDRLTGRTVRYFSKQACVVWTRCSIAAVQQLFQDVSTRQQVYLMWFACGLRLPAYVSHVAQCSFCLLLPPCALKPCLPWLTRTCGQSDEVALPAQEEDKAKDWLLQYKHVAFAHGMFRAATVVLLLTQLAGISTAFTSLIRACG